MVPKSDSGRPLSRSTVNKLVGEVNHGIVVGNPSKIKSPRQPAGILNEAIPTMRFVQPHLNSCFTQTHAQHNTYPSSLPKKKFNPGPNYGVIRTVPRVSLAGGPDQKLAQSQTVWSGTWRPLRSNIALPGYRGFPPWRTFPFFRNSWDRGKQQS